MRLKLEMRTKKYETSEMMNCLKLVEELVIEENNAMKNDFVLRPSYELRCKATLLQKLYLTFKRQVDKEEEESNPYRILESELYPSLLVEFQVMAMGLKAYEKQAMLVGKVFLAYMFFFISSLS